MTGNLFYFFCLWFFFFLILRSTCQIFCRMSSIGIGKMCFSYQSWGPELLKGRPELQCALLIISYQEYIPSTWFITAYIDLGHLDEAEFANFLHWKVSIFPPSQAIWKEIIMYNQHLKRRELLLQLNVLINLDSGSIKLGSEVQGIVWISATLK